jgi:hypothetical protein
MSGLGPFFPDNDTINPYSAAFVVSFRIKYRQKLRIAVSRLFRVATLFPRTDSK